MLRLLYHYFGMDNCKSCETLKIQLEISNHEREELLKTILGLVKPEVIPSQVITTAPLKTSSLPWHIRKKMLENESKIQASINERIKKDEKELGIVDLVDKEIESGVG